MSHARLGVIALERVARRDTADGGKAPVVEARVEAAAAAPDVRVGVLVDGRAHLKLHAVVPHRAAVGLVDEVADGVGLQSLHQSQDGGVILIAFLDSDDLWYPFKLEQQIPLFCNDNVAIVYSNYEKIDEDGNGANRIVRAPKSATYSKLLLGNIIGNLTGVYDCKKVGMIPFMDIHHEDYVMWLTILKQGFIAQNTNTTTAAYRIVESSVSSNKLRVLSWQWNIYRNIEKFGILQSCYYFANYAIKAYIKSTI